MRLLLIAALAAPPALASAQPAGPAETANRKPARAMSLRQVLDVVVRGNPDLARSERDVAIAGAGELEAGAVDDWIVSASGTGSSTRREFVEGQPFQTTAEDSLQLSAQISRGISTGGVVGLEVSGGSTDTEFAVLDNTGAPLQIGSTAFSGSLFATLTQPLWRGAGKKVARAERRRARLASDSATLARQVTAAEAIRAAIVAYWELGYARQVVAIRESSLALAREQLRITRVAIEAKAAAPTEALAIEQAIAVREQAVLVARVEVSERSLALRKLVGLEIGPGEVDLAVTDAPSPAARPVDLDRALAVARDRNPRIGLARLGVTSAAIDVAVARDGRRPALDLSARVGPAAIATGAGETVRQIGGLGSFTASATLSFSQALGRRGARGAERRAVETAGKSKLDRAEVERDVAVEVVRAVNLVRTAHKRIEVSDLAIKLADQNLASEKILAASGEARSFDVLARQDELAQARLDRERAVSDHAIALVELESLTGDLLDSAGVSVDPGR